MREKKGFVEVQTRIRHKAIKHGIEWKPAGLRLYRGVGVYAFFGFAKQKQHKMVYEEPKDAGATEQMHEAWGL